MVPSPTSRLIDRAALPHLRTKTSMVGYRQPLMAALQDKTITRGQAVLALAPKHESQLKLI